MSNLQITLTRRLVPADEPHRQAAYQQSFKLLAALLAEEKEEKPVSVVHNPSVQAAQA